MWSQRIHSPNHHTLTALAGAASPSPLAVSSQAQCEPTKAVGKLPPQLLSCSLFSSSQIIQGAASIVFFSHLTVDLGAVDAWMGNAMLSPGWCGDPQRELCLGG